MTSLHSVQRSKAQAHMAFHEAWADGLASLVKLGVGQHTWDALNHTTHCCYKAFASVEPTIAHENTHA
eukprot:522170-Amphidinium_carterae.1